MNKFNDVEFNVGDEIIHIDGRIGTVKSICTCERCTERGFHEPYVEYTNGDSDYVSTYSAETGFPNFYKIGERIFKDNLMSLFEMYRLIDQYNKEIIDRQIAIERLEQVIKDYK